MWLKDWGLLGLFIGAYLSATVIPFSSDFLVIATILAKLNLPLIFVCATLGSWLGSITTYFMGFYCKWEWIEKIFKIKKEKIEKHKAKIDKWGPPIALFAWLPFVGDLFAIGLGFYKVKFLPVAIYTFIGKALRVLFWIAIYLLVGDKLSEWL